MIGAGEKSQQGRPMWIIKGTFLGTWMFAFGTMPFLYKGVQVTLAPRSFSSARKISDVSSTDSQTVLDHSRAER